MRITIDTEARTLSHDSGAGLQTLPLYSDAAFEILSRQWVKVGWNRKYSYTFTWLGRPLIQLPEDVLRIQEVIWAVQPDVIIETGVAHGGSLIFYASLCKAIGRGRVIGVDIEIRPHNRQAIEAHPLAGAITLIEGDSTAPAVVDRVRRLVQPGETVLVILDSCHTGAHVLAELEAYHPMVTTGSYIVATDGIMHDLHDTPLGRPEWTGDNPTAAAREFAARHPEFQHGQPPWPFNESTLRHNVTHWPEAFLRRVR
ncbi:MAG: CmcI family methyltransferase [Limisphaerales bacterium]